jgi:hypothetical protein
MDFITGLPIIDGFDCIATSVGTFSEQAHFTLCWIHINAPHLAHLFLDNLYTHHGLCRTKISDRGPKFTSEL